MLTNADLAVLKETYRSSKTVVTNINHVLSKVYDEDLALDLNKQLAEYQRMEEKAAGVLNQNGIRPEKDTALDKARTWSSVQASTLLNTSTGHIADMMIQENAQGMTNMMKVLKHNRPVKGEYDSMANELMDLEELNIRKLKSYL
ncbi:hypothetical protein [Diplocloster hominis]|uniref:hypothetical protein n=1 Tax=Diplocloster hominis TaxID=3079010 RepID=UPI0031B9BC0C